MFGLYLFLIGIACISTTLALIDYFTRRRPARLARQRAQPHR